MTVDTTQHTPRKPPKFLNQIMSLLLRSPLHGLVSNQLVLLTFQGRKTGKSYTIPVGYIRQGDTLLLFTDHNWWKNLTNNAPVTLYLKGKKVRGTAEAIHQDKELIADRLLTFVQRHPRAARAYDVKLDASGQPNRKTVRQAVQRFTLVRIHLAKDADTAD